MKKSFGSKILICPAPVWCIGSYDENEKPNVMTIAWGGICCSNPPAVTVSLRKSRYSFDNIKKRGAYTVNVPSADYAREADYFGMVSGKDVDKFGVTGLTPVKSEVVDAPYIEEFPMVLECELMHIYEIGEHFQFIGKIMDVKVDESLLDAEGHPDMGLISPFVFAPGTRSYYQVGDAIGKAFLIGREIGR